MFDLDKEFLALTKKYGFDLDDPELNLYELYIQTFREEWEKIPDDEPVAVYGYSNAFFHVYDRVISQLPKNLVCIIENQKKCTSFHSIPILPLEDVASTYELTAIFLTGFHVRAGMTEDLTAQIPSARYIDIYQILEARGFVYANPFNNLSHSMYLLIEKKRRIFESARDEAARSKALWHLIESYLYIRDFVCAISCIDLYIENEYIKFESLCNFKSEFALLVESLKKKLSCVSSPKISILFLDGLSYQESLQLNSFSDFRKESLDSSNTFSSGFMTRGSFFSFLSGENYISDGLFINSSLPASSCPTIEKIKSEGYSFNFIGTSYFSFLNQINDYVLPVSMPQTLSYSFWSYLCHSLKEKTPSITVIYGLETHTPFFNGLASTDLKDVISPFFNLLYSDSPGGSEQDKMQEFSAYLDTLKSDMFDYVDKQTGFYLPLVRLLSRDVIIMSDHGSWFPSWNLPRDRDRVTFIINSANTPWGPRKSIGSLIHFPFVLQNIVSGRSALDGIPDISFARREIEPFYGKTISFIKHPNRMGCIEFISDEEIYSFYLDGREKYVRLPSEADRTHDPAYADRIAFFRGELGIDLHAFWKNIFEKYPHLYKLYGDFPFPSTEIIPGPDGVPLPFEPRADMSE